MAKKPITINPQALPAWNAELAKLGLPPSTGGGTYNAAAPVPPKPAPPTVGAEVNAALTTYGNTAAQINQQEQALGLNYGFNANGTLNAATPYGRAQLLDRSFKQQTQGNTNSYAREGQLYSGALQNRQASTGFNYLANRDALLKQYQNVMAQLELQRQGAKGNYLSSTGMASAQATEGGYAQPYIPSI